jgi:hypothetical protein
MKLLGIESDSILLAITLLPAAYLIYQDFNQRFINLGLVMTFGVLIIVSSLVARSLVEVAIGFLANSVFILMSLLCIKGALLVKQRNQKLLDVFGLGDVVIWFILAIALEPKITPTFFTVVFFAAIAGYFIIHRKKGTIPLAGYMLMGYILYVLSPLLT